MGDFGKIIAENLRYFTYMNKPVELPSGKILNIARFVALIPNTDDSHRMSYDLLISGYSNPISLEASDASALKQILQLEKAKLTNNTYSDWDKEEQLKKNQKARYLLAKRIERHQNMSEEESKERADLFESFKHSIDLSRLPEQKLYSQIC
ncbi:MAG: hypothetical protein SAK29_13035 [Scytonema sp. PMC 1069.18]|nr:hypothetical protein [Scytonema sp. PMC 1069.18]MEC4880519.1 hypothetical protein [Scytonema sp. PMC 1070.18]